MKDFEPLNENLKIQFKDQYEIFFELFYKQTWNETELFKLNLSYLPSVAKVPFAKTLTDLSFVYIMRTNEFFSESFYSIEKRINFKL